MNDLHKRIMAAGPGGVVPVTQEELTWLSSNPVRMGRIEEKRRRSVDLVEWCARQKGLIERHNLPMEPEWIVEAVNKKSRQLGGKGEDSPSTILSVWRAIRSKF